MLCWGVRKLGIYAHEKLAVCNLGWAKLRGVFCCVGAVCALVALSVSSSLSFRHSCILGTFVGVKELKRGCYLRYVYIFRFGVGVVAV